MTVFYSDSAKMEPNESLESRVDAALLPYLRDLNNVDQAPKYLGTVISRLRDQLSIWVGPGGSQAVIDRAVQLAERECPFVTQLSPATHNPAPAKNIVPDLDLSVDQARQCIRVLVLNVFGVVQSLTGNVLINPLIKSLNSDSEQKSF